MTISEMKNPRLQILMLVLIVFFGFGFFNFYLSIYLEKRNIDISLKKFAENMNSECPHTIENEIVLDKVSFVKKRNILFEYRWLHNRKDDFDNIQQLKENLIEVLIKDIESIEELMVFRNKDVIFNYFYFDNQGEIIFNIKLLLNTPIAAID